MSLRFYTRVYTPRSSSDFKNQLNIWCDRVHISHIRFSTNLTSYRDGHGHALYQAILVFPRIGASSTGTQFYYDESAPVALTIENLVGWGTSKKDAEEMAARRLLESGQYCFY